MESNTLSSVVDRTCVDVISDIAPAAASPIATGTRLDMSGRFRTAPVMDSRSQGGVGSYRVEGMWRSDDRLDHQDPKFTHKFSTRQGPPTCSPPV